MGNWTLEMPDQKLEMTLEQTFQKISGTLALQPIQAGLREPRLYGAAISFSYVGQDGMRRDLSGRVDGSRMEGTFRDERNGQGRWSAVKK
jgi:hypothetical protein